MYYRFLLLSSLLLPPPLAGAESELSRHLDALRAVGPEGKGNREATQAWRSVVSAGPASLPEILGAFRGASPLASNWLMTAVDALCESELRRGGSLPVEKLEAFVLDLHNDPRARWIAYGWIARVDPSAPDRILPRIGDDPSVDLRRDAVARIIQGAGRLRDQGLAAEALATYRRALDLARDIDQVDETAARLKDLGETVDVARHFGFLCTWKLIGPFDNTGSTSFDRAYPPEAAVDLTAEYEGKLRQSGTDGTGPIRLRWTDHSTTDSHGVVDLNRALGRHKGSIAYATAELTSDRKRPVEIRIGCVTAWKLWVNGRFLFGHEEYHHGMEMDQFRVPVELQEGKNTVLLKVCQNEQTEDWAQEWRFQLRVCDASGTAVPSTARSDGTGREARL